jgi:outer membrane protein OmpA-like peptidoglycan-associated protein
VSSANGAPFRFYEAPPAAAELSTCPEPPAPTLGCGAIVHGVLFNPGSALLRAESEPVLERLVQGLREAIGGGPITIEGHTADEVAEASDQVLSERRAAVVRTELIRRGMPAGRLRATGAGSTRPIAGNGDENGRSMNRRFEIRCG